MRRKYPKTRFSIVRVYPNPATNAIAITFPVTGKYAVRLLNSAGQLVSRPVQGAASSVTIAVPNLAAGIYILEITFENSTETREIAIRK